MQMAVAMAWELVQLERAVVQQVAAEVAE